MLRFADGELDLLVLRARRYAAKQGAQLFEGVGLELGEMRIHLGVAGDVGMRIITENAFATP